MKDCHKDLEDNLQVLKEIKTRHACSPYTYPAEGEMETRLECFIVRMAQQGKGRELSPVRAIPVNDIEVSPGQYTIGFPLLFKYFWRYQHSLPVTLIIPDGKRYGANGNAGLRPGDKVGDACAPIKVLMVTATGIQICAVTGGDS